VLKYVETGIKLLSDMCKNGVQGSITHIM